MIHLDANASTPMLPEVLEAMLPWLRDGHANPSGAYAGARRARAAIEQAREQVAAWIGAESDEIIFTSGGTESVNTALHSLDRLVGTGAAVVSSIEHTAVLRCVEDLARLVKFAPVHPDGRLDLEQFATLLPGAAMISVMASNNETGVIQPLREICTMARERGIPVHSDAVQSAGKTELNVRHLGADFLSLSAHKFHGPKGVGALYARRGIRFFPFHHGGSQENGRRGGTENTPGIVGMGAAAAAMLRRGNDHRALHLMRDTFESALLDGLPGVVINGDPVKRLPNTSHLSFAACAAVDLIQLLDQAGIECSAGSACMAGKIRPSHVQLAMGIDGARGRGSLRFSFSILNTAEEARNAAAIVKQAVERLRQMKSSATSPCGLAFS
ncbi:MAG: cysteine desulfurase family protein [Luteolibacter sp.]|jgi:cysteine desulfurase|nr:cysteine desulfurase family protein [Luteolibacter sp.]